MEEPRIPARDFDARDFGLRADGADALPALTRALAACHAAGGGRVVVGPGEYRVCGPVVFLSRVNLHLERGALLRFSGEPADFLPPVFQRWEGTEVYSHSPLITARGATDIALTGEGVVDGQGGRVFAGWQPVQGPDKERLRDLGRDGVPVEHRVFGAGTHLRPSLFQPIDCERVLLEGVTLRDSPFWVIHPTYCRQVTVRGVTVDSLNHNNDGCDPDSCTDVRIERCVFRTGDDGVAIKSGRDEDGWRVGRPTERVWIRDCEFESRINGICIGSEMSGGVRDVRVERCRVRDAASALYLNGNSDRGGVIERVVLEGIEVERARVALVRFEPAYHSHRGGTAHPVFRDVEIRDVSCRTADQFAFFIEGNPEQPVRGVRLQDIAIGEAGEPVWMRHVRDVRFENVTIAGRPLPEVPEATPADAVRPELRM